MKLMTIFIFLIGSGLGIPAFADTGSDSILQDPTVVAIAKLMNDKHHGHCDALKDSDIVVHGTGYIPEVSKPTLRPNALLFTVTVHCKKESAAIHGRITSWELVLPRSSDPELAKLKPDPVSAGNSISEVTFSKE